MDRFRLLAALLAIVLLAVLAIPAGVAAAQILPLPGPAAATSPAELEEEAEDEAEETEEGEGDECEFEDEALEQACEEKVEEEEAEEAEAEECRLESAEATVAALPGRDQVRLTVRYKAFEPSAVAIALALRGAKGALDLGTETTHFGRSGTLHATHTLTAPQMTRAMAAKEFTVGIHALNTPGFCTEAFAQHLTSRKGAGAALQWTDPSAERRAKASRARPS